MRAFLLSAAIIGITSLAAQALLAPAAHAASILPLAEGSAGQGGTHPWDARKRDQLLYRYDFTYSYDFVERLSRSRFRTVTHALHPYYRGRYYAATAYDLARYGSRSAGLLEGEYPEPVLCSNFTYDRANYRTPPSRFRCQ